MTISEYIEKLKDFREAQGDLEVWAEGSESCPERLVAPEAVELYRDSHGHLSMYKAEDSKFDRSDLGARVY